MPIIVNFHLHSNFSDGELTPEALVANLSAAGVRFTSLTDHDTIEGLPRFQKATKKRGISSLPGVELTTWFNGSELHLLGFGFDPEFDDLRTTLVSLRQVQDLGVHSITGSLRKMGANHPGSAEDSSTNNAAPGGRLEIAAAIDLIHRAGGKTFLAHPFMYESDPARLDLLIGDLKTLGLDGLEAFYAPFSSQQQESLVEIARKHDLPVSAGTDLHLASEIFRVEIPEELWTQFRQSLFTSPALNRQSSISNKNNAGNQAANPTSAKPHHFKRRSYIVRIFLPTLIAIGLFLAVIWGIILPTYEQTLLERKRELIRELTNSAWSILASYELDERNGLFTREEAQAQAITRVQALRYGEEGKDYFWIQDMQPRMVMHPYRSDLNGQDVSEFTDPRGVAIFVEFARQVERAGEGYLNYVWQWKDDPARLEPKESFVKGFSPWGWVIGTGIYTDDVRAEIDRLERNLVQVSLVISGVVVLLLSFVLHQSLKIERERQEILDDLHDSTERYHSLVEATTEGTLLIIDDHCRYANQTFLSMSGYTEEQLEFLGLSDLLHPAENTMLWEKYDSMIETGSGEGEAIEGVLSRADGNSINCVLGISPIQFAGQNGFILLCRDVTTQVAQMGSDALGRAAQYSELGIFRTKAERYAALLDSNPAARAYFSKESASLANLFVNPADFEDKVQKMLSGEEIQNHILQIETGDGSMRYVAFSARLVREEEGEYFIGTLRDVTGERKQEIIREALIEKLQASLLFLHEPLSRLEHDVLICDLNTTVTELARLMSERGVTAALVSSDGAEIGIVTDHDLRARVLTGNSPVNTPIHTIMSAPITRISEDAPVYEALMRMEEKGVRHLAVENRDGKVVSVVDNKSLIKFQDYGTVVLSREIARALSQEEIVHHTNRTPLLAKTLLESSARPRYVTRTLSSFCDSVTERLVQLAIEELGEPPADFSFIAMGSQGRQEQTLITDQDNGIIFVPHPDSDPQGTLQYFLKLGKMVNDGLAQAGYLPCRGGVMAGQPRWCRPLTEWKSGSNEWIQKSEPQEIIDFSVFFDFRTIYGDAELARELRFSIFSSLEDQPAFYTHLAQNALTFKPPFRLLGNIYLGGGATEHTGEINLKDAMMPMVSFSRLYALRHQMNQTHTEERIEALTDRAIILPSSCDEFIAAYDFMMQLRLQTQVNELQAGRSPTNIIHPARLSYIQKELLKQAFTQIAAVQKKIRYDFLGGG
jgi:PAS domain S-box-containing protein